MKKTILLLLITYISLTTQEIIPINEINEDDVELEIVEILI